MLRTALLLAASLVLGQPAVAAEQTKDAAPQVTDLAWLLGEWRGEYVLPEGIPEVGPAGSKVVSVHTWRWTLNKKFITLKIREEINGRVASTGEEILGTDQDSGALAHWFFGSTGVHGNGTWRRNGDSWELIWRAAAPGGKKYEAIGDHIQIDADSYTWQIRDLRENGRKIPDWPKVTYRRKTGAPAAWAEAGSSAPPLLKEYGKLMVGQWECKSAVPWIPVPGAATVPARGTCSWMLGGAALQWNLRVGEVDAHALVGWDPEAKRLEEFVVTSTGDSFLVFVTKEGDNWVTTADLTMPDGSRKAVRAVTTFDNNGNRHVNEYPTHKDVFTRVPTK